MEGERILIAGAGYLGVAVGQLLVREGHQVWALRRNPQNLPPEFRRIAGDLTRASALPQLPQVDRVIYAAGPDGSREEDYRATFVAGIRLLAERLGTAPRRWLFTSSTAVYGQANGEEVDEESPTTPGTATGECLLTAEGIFGECGIPSVVVRLGGLYGPGRQRLLDAVRAGPGRHAEPGNPSGPLRLTEAAAPCRVGVSSNPLPRWVNRIHRDDAAGAVKHLLFMESPAALYVATDCEPTDPARVTEWIAHELGVAPPPVETASRRRNASNKRCSNARIIRSGYAFRYPTFREGYGSLIRGAIPSGGNGGVPAEAAPSADRDAR